MQEKHNNTVRQYEQRISKLEEELEGQLKNINKPAINSIENYDREMEDLNKKIMNGPERKDINQVKKYNKKLVRQVERDSKPIEKEFEKYGRNMEKEEKELLQKDREDRNLLRDLPDAHDIEA